MFIPLQIPRILQRYCDEKEEIQLQGSSIRELLADLQRQYPALYVCLCNETGAIRQHINLFVNHDLIRFLQGLETPLAAGDVVSVFQAVSGG